MIKKIQKYIKEGRNFGALEISESAGEPFYRYLEVRNVKEELIIQNWQTGDSLDDILSTISNKIPVCLIVNNKQVLSKMVDKAVEEPLVLIQEIYPNLDIKSFYYEIIQESEKPILSIAKRTYIDELLNRIQRSKVEIVQIQLGISAQKSLLPFWEKSHLFLPGIKVEVSNAIISSISKVSGQQEMVYELGALEIRNSQLLPFATILSYITNDQSNTNLGELNYHLKRDFKYIRYSRMAYISATIVFLFLLFLNFIIYSFYHQKTTQLSATLDLNAEQQNHYRELQQTIEIKQNKLDLFKGSAWSSSSLYLDKLAADLPTSILLDELIYQPLETPLRNEKPINYLLGKIRISGKSNQSEEFTQWIIDLEQKPWIKSVETSDYGTDKGANSNFTVEITIDETES